jgi:hypothetical protein
MALGSTQPLLKMSTRDVPGGKGGRCVRLTTYHHTVPMSRNLGALTFLDPSGPAWPVMGVLYLYLVYWEWYLDFLQYCVNIDVVFVFCSYFKNFFLSAKLHSIYL